MRPLQAPGLAQEPRGEAAREVVSQFCLGQGGALVLYSTTPGFSILVMSMSCAAAERASSRAPRSGRAIMSITWAAFCNPREYLKAVDLRLIFCAQVRVRKEVSAPACDGAVASMAWRWTARRRTPESQPRRRRVV